MMLTDDRRAHALPPGHRLATSASARDRLVGRVAGAAIVLGVVAALADPIGAAVRSVRARVAPLAVREPFVVAVVDAAAPGDRRAAAQVRRRIGDVRGLRVRAVAPDAAATLLLDACGDVRCLRAAPGRGFEGAFGARDLLAAELPLRDGIGRAHPAAVAALALAAVVPPSGEAAREQAVLLRRAMARLETARTNPRLPVATRAEVAAIQPIAAAALAELTGDLGAMRDAAAGFHRMLVPGDAMLTARARGTARHDLGVVLTALGAHDRESALLIEGVASLRAALRDRPRATAPQDWAATQHALGRALVELERRDGGGAAGAEAVAAYLAALDVRTRDRAPAAWAATQADLGRALLARGLRAGRAADLEAAVAAFRRALDVQRADSAPFAWAGTQHDLGRTLVALADGAAGTAALHDGVAALRAALTVRTRERVPVAWIATANELGGALTTLGQREDRREHLQEAAELLGSVVAYESLAGSPLDPATSETNHAAALAALGEYENGRTLLQTAVRLYEAALLVPMRERDPAAWATTENNRGLAYLALAPRNSGSVKTLGALDSAVAAFERALTVRTRESQPAAWAATQHNLGSALATRGTGRSATTLRAALAAYDRALAVRTRDATPVAWAATQNGRGRALVALGVRERNDATVDAGIAALREARDVMRQVGADGYVATIERNLATAERQRAASARRD